MYLMTMQEEIRMKKEAKKNSKNMFPFGGDLDYIEEDITDGDTNIYVLNHEGKLVKFQEYPYVAKADLNGWSVENGKIKITNKSDYDLEGEIYEFTK